MFTGTICVNDTGQARSIHTIFTVDTICSIIAVLDGDIDGSSRLSICTFYAIGASRACQADMAFRAILAIDSFHGHTIFAISAFDGDAVFAVNTNTGLAVLATDADAAGSTGSTIFAILAVYSQLFHGHILIHEDGDVAIFIDLRSQIISRVFMALFLGSALNLHRAAQRSRIFVPKISCEFQSLACQTCSGTFCNGLDIADVGSIRLACFCDVTSSIFFNATAYLGDLATVDINIAIGAKGNLSTGGLAAFGLLIADGRDTRQIFCQLDLQLAAVVVDADVAFCQVALRTADDIESVVELLVNDSRIIALEFQAVFHGSYLMFTSTIFVDDTCQACTIDAFFTFDTILAICSSFSIITILDGDINGSSRLSICTIYAIGASRACQADMAFCTIFTIDSFHGHAILAVVALDGDAILTVNANAGLAVPAVDADAAGSTIFAILAVYSKFFHGHILIHEDGDVAFFIDLRSQIISRVFMALFLGSALNLHRAAQLSRVFIPRISRKFQSLICIGFDLCIESTQVLASRIVCRHIIQCLASFCNRRIIVVQRLARYQLVGSRSIRSSIGCACSKRFCTKSLAPGVFIGFLLVCCCIGFCNGFSIIANGVGLQISANVRCVRFSIRFQLFHDHGIMGINAVSGFDEAVIVGRLICCFCFNRILSVIVPRPICID